jgi:hypothetical protein
MIRYAAPRKQGDTMVDTASFAKLVPGFDFLEGLVKNAGSAMPGIGQWVAPTLNPEELEKRIAELRTVQYWLEQNARMLGATIQALEVQRMTLSTLKTMNVQMSDLRDSLMIPVPAAPAASGAAAATAAQAEPAAAPVAPAAVDPMQWWGALTKQFTELAASALKEGAAGAAARLGGAMPGASPAAAAKPPRQAAGAAAKARQAAPRKRSANR